MFARKKPQDFQSSLQRFTAMCRDPMSRAKHLKIIFDNLNSQEKRQVIEGFSFEIYHLLNGLIFTHYDLPADPQTPIDLESALAILEQVLLFAPEFIGKGWQRNGMEFIFKMILHPKNAIAVRKLAIRLFIIWYQILSVSGHSCRQLDLVFQCCLPDFPLRNGQSAEQIMTIYCEGCEPTTNNSIINNHFGIEPCSAKCILPEQPTSPQGIPTGKVSARERADNLQKYIDKFLEYNIRETVKINWQDPNQRLDCAKFLIDRIIVLYIYEQFPEAEANGIDVYDGWEGTFEDDENARLQDTADPIIIAKYWLIRWMVNIAFGPPQPMINGGHQQEMKNSSNTSITGIQLFKQALFSSRRATNILLTLIREAFRLPLACINVIQKSIELLRYWLFQEELLNFIDTQLVSVEDWSLLLIRMLFSFFRSPYLNSPGEKLPSAISLTHSILQIVRDLANPSTILPRPLSKRVWQELLNELIYALEFVTAKPDPYGKATAGGFARNFVSILIFIRTIRDIEIDDNAMWDDLVIILQNCIWPEQVMEQWSRIVPNLTRALILNIFKMEIGSEKGSVVSAADELSSSSQQQHSGNMIPSSRADRNSNGSGSTSGGSSIAFNAAISSLCDGMDEEERQFGIVGNNVNGTEQQASIGIGEEKWMRAWMRVVCLANYLARPSPPPPNHHHHLAIIQTLGRAMEMLHSTGCANSIIHWLCAHLFCLENVAKEPHAIPIIFNVLISASPPPLERAYILRFLLQALRAGDHHSVPILLDHIPLINDLEDMAVISMETISTLQKLVKNQEFSSRAIRVAALLSLNHPEAEKILISLLEQRQIQIDQFSLTLCVNALSLLILERADAALFDHLLNLLFNHQYAARVLPIFCANIGLVIRLGFHSQLMDSLMLAQSKVKNANALNDLKWQICSINSKESISSHWSALSEKFFTSCDEFFDGFMIRLSGQFPLPGFNITQWNSLPFRPQQQQSTQTAAGDETYNDTFMDTGGAIISLEKVNPQTLWSRTCIGRHSYQIEAIQIEEEKCSQVDNWLNALSDEQFFASQFTASARKKSIEEIFDPFKEFPTPSIRSFSPSSMPQNSSADLIPSDISVPEMLQFIQSSSRSPEELNLNDEEEGKEEKDDDEGRCGWRQFLTSFGLLDVAKNPPNNFQREIRHLDNTICREVHKVAVIYVGKDQEDKQSILSNISGSDNFNKFVDALGWTVQIGQPEFFGYTGGLPNGQLAPYFATANTELIFHVSTLLAGDTTQRLKHIGNDEVHVVWSENASKPYRRDLIATRFCDILIVLYVVSPVLLRVHIEVQDQRIQFGPLFDGACIHTHQAASLVRETVLNASRAYRNLKVECDRPNKHREKVFNDTRQLLQHLSLSASITRLFASNSKTE